MGRVSIPVRFDSSHPDAILNNTGNRMTLNLGTTIRLPNDVPVYFNTLNTSFWFTTPNISAAKNNNVLAFTVGATPYTFTLADGLYSLDDLDQVIADFLIDNGLDPELLDFEGVNSTGHVTLTINGTGVSIDWATATVGSILGFVAPGDNIVSNTSSGDVFISSQKATLNQIESILFHVSFVSSGFFNSQGSSAHGGVDICSRSLIRVPPGSQQADYTFYPVPLNVGVTHINSVTVYVTDNNNNDIILTEPFILDGLIYYDTEHHPPTDRIEKHFTKIIDVVREGFSTLSGRSLGGGYSRLK